MHSPHPAVGSCRSTASIVSISSFISIPPSDASLDSLAACSSTSDGEAAGDIFGGPAALFLPVVSGWTSCSTRRGVRVCEAGVVLCATRLGVGAWASRASPTFAGTRRGVGAFVESAGALGATVVCSRGGGHAIRRPVGFGGRPSVRGWGTNRTGELRRVRCTAEPRRVRCGGEPTRVSCGGEPTRVSRRRLPGWTPVAGGVVPRRPGHTSRGSGWGGEASGVTRGGKRGVTRGVTRGVARASVSRDAERGGDVCCTRCGEVCQETARGRGSRLTNTGVTAWGLATRTAAQPSAADRAAGQRGSGECTRGA